MYYKELTDCETMVMKCIWNAGREISVQEIIDKMAEEYGKEMKRTTASTFILKLRDKSYIEGRQEGRNVYYHPLVCEDDYRRSRAKDYLDFWYDGSLESAVAMLCESAEMPLQKCQAVKKMVEELR
ncbi:MAG: BlaI/MecI/CopY family transcriptional regulator [Lachnospiraceae bacterium]|nr:BlaI/MecI/CopY family transcriptional regulator [Lachnospiraceae bacterium]